MRTLKTRERTGLSPGSTFLTWIDCDAIELNVRKVAKEFAEWINSYNITDTEDFREAMRGGQKYDGYSGLKKIFLELTQLTVDHVREQRTVRSRGLLKRHTTGLPYVKKINLILVRIQEQYPVRLQMRDFAAPDGRIVFHDRPIITPSAEKACARAPQRFARAAAERKRFEKLGEKMDRFDEAHTASYALKMFHFLADHDAFAAFRRCELRACGKYFFPLRPERCYCSKGCQRKHYMEDPKRKDKNAAEQKVNYYTHKVTDLAKLAAKNSAYGEQFHRAEKLLTSAKAKRDALKRRQ